MKIEALGGVCEKAGPKPADPRRRIQFRRATNTFGFDEINRRRVLRFGEFPTVVTLKISVIIEMFHHRIADANFIAVSNHRFENRHIVQNLPLPPYFSDLKKTETNDIRPPS